MKFSKYSAASVFSNWLYNSERKPGIAGNYQFFENVDFLFQALKDSAYIRQINDVNDFEFQLNPNIIFLLICNITFIVFFW